MSECKLDPAGQWQFDFSALECIAARTLVGSKPEIRQRAKYSAVTSSRVLSAVTESTGLADPFTKATISEKLVGIVGNVGNSKGGSSFPTAYINLLFHRECGYTPSGLPPW